MKIEGFLGDKGNSLKTKRKLWELSRHLIHFQAVLSENTKDFQLFLKRFSTFQVRVLSPEIPKRSDGCGTNKVKPDKVFSDFSHLTTEQNKFIFFVFMMIFCWSCILVYVEDFKKCFLEEVALDKSSVFPREKQ